MSSGDKLPAFKRQCDDESMHQTRRAATRSVVHAAPLQQQSVLPAKVQGRQKLKTDFPSTPKYVWALNEVPVLPDFYRLERTATFVPNTSPSVVSERISDILRERSVEATYEDDKAKVKCVSADGVEFRVRLFRGRGKFQHGIIVEVQRRFGTAMSFHGDAQAILCKAENKEVPPPPPSLRASLISDESESSDGDLPDGTGTLASVSKMFSAGKADTLNTGFQLLAALTDANKMGRRTSKSVSKKLLEADNEIAARVLSLVLDGREEDELYKFRTTAFTILANVLQAAPEECLTVDLRERLKDVLINELEASQENPRIAVQASRCVEKLLLRDGQFDADLHGPLQAAREAGAARHAGLEAQAVKCLGKYP